MHFNKGKSKDCSQLICIIDFFIYSFFHSFVTSIYIYCCSGLIFHPLRIKPSKDKQVYRWSRLLKELWDDDEKRYFSSRLTNIIFDPIHVLCIAFDAVILIQDLILFWTLRGGRGKCFTLIALSLFKSSNMRMMKRGTFQADSQT